MRSVSRSLGTLPFGLRRTMSRRDSSQHTRDYGPRLGAALFLICGPLLLSPLVPPVRGDSGPSTPAPAAETPQTTGAICTPPDRTYEPWKYGKTDGQGYPLDRRFLTAAVSVSEANISVAAFLSALQEQTEVKLSAFEPELQKQKLTVFARCLPLNGAMLLMARLLDLCWYQRSVEGHVEYALSYGSSPPSVRVDEEAKAQQAELRPLLASRIDDYRRALSLSPEELRLLAQSDPMLAGAMLRYPGTRYGAEVLTTLRPETLRTLIDTGEALVGPDELPAWIQQGLRDHYDPEVARHLGITSPDMFVSRFRPYFYSRPPLRPGYNDVAYSFPGGDAWQGLRFVAGVLGAPAGGVRGTTDAQQRDHVPKDFVPFSYLPFVEKKRGTGNGWLPGRMEGSGLAEAYFADVLGMKTDKTVAERWAALYGEKAAQRRAELAQSPWSEDKMLSQRPTFTVRRQISISKLLADVAGQTGYVVIATYFEERDAPPVEGVSQEEPLYVLLNRVSRAANCSWALEDSVIRWVHSNWCAFEAEQSVGK